MYSTILGHGMAGCMGGFLFFDVGRGDSCLFHVVVFFLTPTTRSHSGKGGSGMGGGYLHATFVDCAFQAVDRWYVCNGNEGTSVAGYLACDADFTLASQQ